MTLEEAFVDFTNSPVYKEQVKQRDSLAGKFRGYLSRFKAGKLKAGAMVEILLANGYQVVVKKTKTKVNTL